MNKNKPNHLIKSTSPYLLQHAYNPVNWYPWGKEALELAKKQDKPILVSIGYSSCHWCHVMEKESFENDSIADIMNQYFINIKIDREERPDLDQIYMDALQAMGQNGGWPLNVFLTPDQKPFYGGTYFPPNNWARLLTSVNRAFNENREGIQSSADKLTAILSTNELEKYGFVPDKNPFEAVYVDEIYKSFSSKFDLQKGGLNKAPKFPMPSNWKFLLNYYYTSQNEEALNHALFTLKKIALGGIYDHIGGGFARYSTDADWFAPHFEKMLYDNGQLLELYADAFKITGDTFYKNILSETYQWLEREMSSPHGGLYSAIDADSEGEEGKFYVWTAAELEAALEKKYPFAVSMFNITQKGNWENGNNILYKEMASLTENEEHFDKIQDIKSELLNVRNKRAKPLTDTKILAGWNAMTISGLLNAYEATCEDKYLDMALKTALFLEKNMIEGNLIYRSFKDGKKSGTGYLEDYAFVITAFIDMYQSTFDEKWILKANQLMDYTIKNFWDENESLFYFTSHNSEQLIARKKEIFDNVIPSSNSQMAINLHNMGIIMDNSDYMERSVKMIRQVTALLKSESAFLINWAILYNQKIKPTAEIVIMGEKAEEFRKELSLQFISNAILMGSKTESDMPLLEYKLPKKGETTIYVCYNKTCKLPVNSVSMAIKQLQ
ncbi:MAG: thioredoxin domain-containing protein [Cyclobacteriaceae bacterium]|nr:thioredoxin domain-containing protein [Cyclobacteriaceae bacterium]